MDPHPHTTQDRLSDPLRLKYEAAGKRFLEDQNEPERFSELRADIWKLIDYLHALILKLDSASAGSMVRLKPHTTVILLPGEAPTDVS
jgi:hypothetical protein